MAEPIVTLDVRKMVVRERHPTIFSRLTPLVTCTVSDSEQGETRWYH